MMPLPALLRSVIFVFCAEALQAQLPPNAELHWVEGHSPVVSEGATLGIPWPQGKVPRDTTFVVESASGKSVPAQTWPLATWPDGSLKWSAFALAPEASPAEKYTVHPGPASVPARPLVVQEDAETIRIDTGVMQCRLPKKGSTIIESISRDGRETARDGKLVVLRRDAPEMKDGWKEESFTGEISAVTLEQSGPVRAVVKIEGRHTNAAGRKWLPFVLRLYFYAGSDSIKVLHTFIFDGDAATDFISGLGLRFTVPISGPLYDRHVRFVGEDHGLWAEAVQGITGLRRDPGQAVRDAQIAGLATPPLDQWDKRVSANLNYVSAFGDFTLFQPTADSFEIRKRTREGFSWLNSAYGKRAAGLGYVGSPTGGLAFGIRNFWQSHPTQLDIRGATTDAATVTMWLWSPESRPMDMRFYHDDMGEDTFEKQLQGLEITYEDYEPGYSTPMGVARTSEMRLWALPSTPTREETVQLADTLRTPPQLVCQPADYHAAGVFGGIWGLPDRSTPTKARIEDQLDFYFAYYKKQVEDRHWYGFWNFGDVMHTYDSDRHVWRYDVGGFAWDNSELSTDLWLWYSFLRSGRADIYRMAEAMTRHTGEVDVYHLGRFAGLGTRHGVMHWGDSAKQLRISTAANRRFLYYLTADERVGDLLWEEVDADRRLADVPPGRKIRTATPDGEKKSFPFIMTVGTDWGSVSAALITAWERTGDPKYRDKLTTSMKSMAALPHGWFSGQGGYDPATGKFIANGNEMEVIHLNAVFGAVEINAELLQLLDVPEYRQTWLQYCELYNASADEQKKALGKSLGPLNLAQSHSRLTAFVAAQKKDSSLAARAWKEFFTGSAGPHLLPKPYPVTEVQGPDVLNPIEETQLSTNAVAQWGLAAIQCLDQIGNSVPEQPDK